MLIVRAARWTIRASTSCSSPSSRQSCMGICSPWRTHSPDRKQFCMCNLKRRIEFIRNISSSFHFPTHLVRTFRKPCSLFWFSLFVYHLTVGENVFVPSISMQRLIYLSEAKAFFPPGAQCRAQNLSSVDVNTVTTSERLSTIFLHTSPLYAELFVLLCCLISEQFRNL